MAFFLRSGELLEPFVYAVPSSEYAQEPWAIDSTAGAPLTAAVDDPRRHLPPELLAQIDRAGHDAAAMYGRHLVNQLCFGGARAAARSDEQQQAIDQRLQLADLWSSMHDDEGVPFDVEPLADPALIASGSVTPPASAPSCPLVDWRPNPRERRLSGINRADMKQWLTRAHLAAMANQ